MNEEQIQEVWTLFKEYLDKMRSSRVEKPKHITRYFKIYSKKKPLIRYMSYFRMLLATLLGRTWGYSNTAFKKNKKPWGNKNSQMRIWEHFLFRENLRLKNISIKKYYESMCSEVDFNKKFIYFAAPYQPEAFSNLITGLYEDVFIILDNLSKVIPKNWVIYYKEHPGTFNEIDKGALGRNKEFYDRLKTYSQVIPLKSSENHYLLIDKSIAAATTGGSVGWEAIVRGKPSILFGAMWYSSCHGVFNVYSYQDLEKAIESIKKGFSPDDKQVDRYAETMRQCSYKGLITPMFFRELIPKAENPKREMEKIASAYIESYEKFYGK